MGMGPAGVFIVESPGVDEMAEGYGEGPIVAEMLKLLHMPYVSRQVESRDDLERDARIYTQRRFDVLLFSAHGAPGMIGLTTGEQVPVREVFRLFKGSPSTAVVFSSCSVLAGDDVREALAEEGAPDVVLGYTSSIYWSSAALASVMLLHGLAQNDFGRLLSTLLAISGCTRANICGYMRTTESDTHQWFSTEAFMKHASEVVGAKNEIQLSSVIAEYMDKERERFQARSDEFFSQEREIEESNNAGAERHQEAREALDRLHRPSIPESEGAPE